MKVIPKFIYLLILVLVAAPAMAQQVNPCAADEATQYMHNSYPELEQQKKAFEEKIHQLSKEPAPLSKKGTVYIVPVVFHVIHQYGTENISKSLVEQSIAQLNTDFRGRNSDTSGVHPRWKSIIGDMEIEFRLASKDPNGNCTQGIVRVESAATNDPDNGEVQKLSRWNPERYLNIYVVRSIFSQDGFTTAGYAYLPPASPELDGIVINHAFLGTGRRTLTHEAGHYLALLHPFQGGCPTPGANCSITGDRVCDTPPTKERNFGCNQNQNTCSTDNPNLPDQVENHMDYSSCSRMFTKGQVDRARSALTFYRSTLVTPANNVLTGTNNPSTTVNCKPIADFYSIPRFTCVGQTVRFINSSYNGTTPIIRWHFQGGTPASTTVENPEVVYSTPGTYPVKLVVSNNNGSDSLTKTGYIQVLSNIGRYDAPFLEDFESINLSQDGWETTSTHATIGFQVNNQVGASGTSSLFLNNRNVLSSGELFSFITPSIDIRNITDPVLKFNIAYARRSSNSGDLLRVFISRNCGLTFNIRHVAISSAMAGSKPFVTGNYVPSANDWIELSVDLSAFANQPGVIVKFEFVSAGGNNVYFDDIRITGTQTIGINEQDLLPGNFNIYPNPVSAGSNFFLEVNSANNNMLALEVYDFTGRQTAIKEQIRVKEGVNKIELSPQALNIFTPGIYLIKARIGDAVIVRKLTVFNN